MRKIVWGNFRAANSDTLAIAIRIALGGFLFRRKKIRQPSEYLFSRTEFWLSRCQCQSGFDSAASCRKRSPKFNSIFGHFRWAADCLFAFLSQTGRICEWGNNRSIYPEKRQWAELRELFIVVDVATLFRDAQHQHFKRIRNKRQTSNALLAWGRNMMQAHWRRQVPAEEEAERSPSSSNACAIRFCFSHWLIGSSK